MAISPAQIAEVMRRRIQEGRYKEREKIPAITDLAVEFEVGDGTVKSAREILKSQGYLNAERGIGTFVRPKKDWRLDV